MALRPQVGSIRIAELMATLSYAADLGLGQPMAHRMSKQILELTDAIHELTVARASGECSDVHAGGAVPAAHVRRRS